MSSTDALDRAALQRVVAVANGKGGVGKTSTSTHLSAIPAAGGRRVLLIDLDPQGNVAEDLGYDDGDRGMGLVRAVIAGTPMHVLRDVRPNLDVVPGGEHLSELADHFHSRRLRRREDDESALLGLARAVAKESAGYDLVVVDCPPANSDVLQDAAMEMARYLLIPTHSDKSSRQGIVEMARRFMHVRAHGNPTLSLLGVVLFGVTSSATTVRKAARDWIDEALGGQAPVFDSTIRHVEAAAYEIREQGRLAHELATATGSESMDPRYAKLAGDYRDMAVEVFGRLVELEQQQAVPA